MSVEEKQSSSLSLRGVIGFNGDVPQGLLLHQDDERLIYPLGSTIIVKYLTQKKQFFLQKDGHDHSVSCLALSPSGRYLASGQNAPMGFPAVVVIWDLENLQAVHRLSLHKGKVQSLAFSPNETYLATLGGRDDNKLIIWDVKSGEALCGSPAANEVTLVVKYLHGREDALVTGGINNLRTWEFDRANRKVRPTDCNLGQMKRNVQCIAVDREDEFMYCGTSTGDILKVSLGPKVVKTLGPPKRPFSLGISSVALTGKGNLIVGTGDGVVATVNKDSMTVIKQTQIPGHVTSIQLNKAGDHFFVGTQQCTIHLVHLQTLVFELRNSCHGGRINDIAFPAGYSELFATASHGDIRVWQAASCSELLRVQVPNVECLCVCFSADGASIISGWADGKIRAFGPQTGKQLYVLNDAHSGGVTVVTGTRNSRAIVSGGRDGQVRVWSISPEVQRMVGSMKEHKGTINSIVLSADDTQCISASDDGSCIVWDLERQARANCLFATTQFRSAVYHPDQSQIVTTGTDRKITYWDAVDGQPIRILEGSATSELNTISISADGERFVVGGGDKAVKIYGYDEGICQFRGVGHSGAVTKVCMAPNAKFVVSVGDEGAIFVWQMPEEAASKAEVPPLKVPSPTPAKTEASKSKGSANSSPRLKESTDISARLKTSLRV